MLGSLQLGQLAWGQWAFYADAFVMVLLSCNFNLKSYYLIKTATVHSTRTLRH